MPKGKVKFYEGERGYGAIINDETGQVLTVYANDIVIDEDKMKLSEGQAVEFNIARNRNKETAINVIVIGGSVQTK